MCRRQSKFGKTIFPLLLRSIFSVHTGDKMLMCFVELRGDNGIESKDPLPKIADLVKSRMEAVIESATTYAPRRSATCIESVRLMECKVDRDGDELTRTSFFEITVTRGWSPAAFDCILRAVESQELEVTAFTAHVDTAAVHRATTFHSIDRDAAK